MAFNLFTLAGKGALGVGKFALGGGARRVGTGMLVGGAVGAATSDSNTGTGMFRDIVGGAALGAGIGMATTGTAFRAAKGLAKGALRRAPGAAWGGAKLGGKMGGGAVQMLYNHPGLTLGLGAAGLGLYGLAGSGAGSASYGAGELGATAEAVGGTRAVSDRRFASSAQGLTGGLHRRRHG